MRLHELGNFAETLTSTVVSAAVSDVGTRARNAEKKSSVGMLETEDPSIRFSDHKG